MPTSRVRSVTDAVRRAGIHRLAWDGKNDGGSDVSSGVYFYSLTVDGKQIDTKKMVLIK